MFSTPDERRAREQTRAYQAHLATPVGQAEAAWARGDRIFQVGLDLLNQSAHTVAMATAATRQIITDPNQVLNAIAAIGWELVSGSVVFVEQGQRSRDKFLSSGQQVAVSGAVVGFYLFRRPVG